MVRVQRSGAIKAGAASFWKCPILNHILVFYEEGCMCLTVWEISVCLGLDWLLVAILCTFCVIIQCISLFRDAGAQAKKKHCNCDCQ